MAAPTESMRVKLSFVNIASKPTLPRKLWMLVDLSKTKTVLDLQCAIQSRFNLSCRFQLFVDGCLIPSWEDVIIIRDNEELCIVEESSNTLENGTDVINGIDAQTNSATKREKQQDEEPKKKKKKKKRKYSQAEAELAVDSISAGSTTSTVEGETDTKTSGPNLAAEEVFQYADQSKSRIKEPNEPACKRVCEAVVAEKRECSAMDDAIRKTLEAVTSVALPADEPVSSKENSGQTDGLKRKRRRTRRRKNQSLPKQTDSFHDSSVLETSTPTAETNDSYKGTIPNVKSADCSDGFRVTDFCPKHVKFGESDDEENIMNDNLDQSSTLVENSQFTKDGVLNVESIENKQSTSYNKVGKKNKDLQPTSGTAGETAGQKSSLKCADELHTASEKLHSKSDFSRSRAPKVGCVTTFQKGPFASVKVFNRKQKKKAGSVPLTKEEQLNSVATNKSFIYDNHNQEANNSLSKCSIEKKMEAIQNGAADKLQQAEESTSEISVKDYECYPELIGPPRVGDIIAYKVIEMSENYCPELSNYKEAKVLKYDSQSQDIEVEVLTKIECNKRVGRFDVTIEDEDCVFTNTEEPQTMVKIPWTSLIQPRLVT